MKPSKKEKQLHEEMVRIKDIAFKYRGSHHPHRLECLRIERDALIRSRVLLDYLMIEEAMSLIIMDHVLQDSPK